VSKESVKHNIEEAMAPPELASLLNSIVEFIGRFLVLSSHQLDAIALWIVHSYIFENAYYTPYLKIWSPEMQCGKTLLLEVMEVLAARPWLTGRVTAAVLPRKIDAERPTLLLDESDAAFNAGGDYSESLRGILNTGYRRPGKTSVCVGQGANISYKDFSTYCPKAIAGIGKGLPKTVADRSIDIAMKKKTNSEKVQDWTPDSDAVSEPATRLKSGLDAWSQETECLLLPADRLDALDSRKNDIWAVLFRIAAEAGNQWPERAREAALALSAGITVQDSNGVWLLTDIRAVFDESGASILPTRKLLEALNAMEDSPWHDLHGKPLGGRKLADMLDVYGIAPTTQRVGAEKKPAKCYYRSSFEDAWTRYAPPSNRNKSNETPAAHNDHVNGETDKSNSAPGNPSMLPIGPKPSSAWASGGESVVTDVTDTEEVHDF
jgi:hypothetical protein